MGLLSVIVAAAVAWLWGAAWYMALSTPWLRAAGVPCDEDGKPTNAGSPLPFVLSALAMLLVAGMMRHLLAMSGLAGAMPAAVTGLGVGLFFIAPWIMINNAYAGRPAMLTVIDGGYAVTGATLIGLVLGLFAA
ncbi:DUF1761 family protein [Rhodobacterales bacterium HKCCSP123]|nr:DUF1761 family protein [Rhodobacterales bacterium HKCCSP123]